MNTKMQFATRLPPDLRAQTFIVGMGVMEEWTGFDMSAPVLPEVFLETASNPASFYEGA